MGMFSKKNLEIGDKLCDSDIYFAFPCKGLFVKDWKMILNKKLKKPIKIDQPFLLSHFK